MKVVVTGSTGKVGRATVEHLRAEGYDVRSTDRRPPDGHEHGFRMADLANFGEAVGVLEGCEALVHLGAIPSLYGRPSHDVFANNALGAFNVLEAARMLGIKKVCLASSVNALGLSYSREPRFDYFPVDEEHPTYCEESYGLSKWVGEQVADCFARRYEDMTISSLRYHGVTNEESYDRWYRPENRGDPYDSRKHLWAYSDIRDVVRANRLALEAGWKGHEVFYITNDDSSQTVPSAELAQRCFPGVPLKKPLDGFASFFDNSKAKRLLKWKPEHTWRKQHA
ncbi:MAG: NAD(P)-dependent oxidoreductase [Planctomycetota bacterium]|nr:NAD(P)-dependent oxidoreductase [Planctomycetota bacterium]